MLQTLARLKSRNSIFEKNARASLFSSIHKSTIRDFATISKLTTIRDSEVGSFTSIGENTRVRSTKLGKFCAVSWNVTINAIGHPTNHLTISAFPYYPSLGGFVNDDTRTIPECRIGNDVWVGANSVLMPGVKVADGAIIGAGSVVTKDVGPYEIHAGTPARKIRDRLPSEIKKRLLDLNWWELDIQTIADNIELFRQPATIEILDQIERITSE